MFLGFFHEFGRNSRSFPVLASSICTNCTLYLLRLCNIHTQGKFTVYIYFIVLLHMENISRIRIWYTVCIFWSCKFSPGNILWKSDYITKPTRWRLTHGAAVLWIPIRIRTDPLSFWSAGSGSALGIWIRIQEPKIAQKSEENSSFEVLDVIFWGMKTSPVA